jgi:hypothetical protein
MQGVGGSSPPSSTTHPRICGMAVKLRWYREDESPFVLTTGGFVVCPERANDPDPKRWVQDGQ